MVATPGNRRSYPQVGRVVGTSAGTAAMGNDSRFPRIDAQGLPRPRTERYDMYFEGSLSSTTGVAQTVHGSGTVRRILATVNAVGVNSTLNMSIRVNGSQIASGMLNRPGLISISPASPVNDLDVVSVVLTSLSGQAEGLNASVWVEFP